MLPSPLEQRYEISLRTILLFLGLLALLWVIIQLRTLFAALFIALILSLTLDPIVVRLKSWHIPRTLGVVLTILSVFVIFGGAVAYGLTPMITQLANFLVRLPELLGPFIERIWPLSLTDEVRAQLLNQLTEFSTGLLNTTLNSAMVIASQVGFVLQILLFTLYLLLDWPNMKKRLVGIFTRPAQTRVYAALTQVDHQLGGWVRGELILMAVVGTLTFIGLLALGVDYAFPLALIAAVLEIVPMIGPLVAAVPALVVGFASSPWLGVGVLILYLVVQQLENSLIVPHVMKRVTGFPPLVTLIILFIGGKLFGLGGVILSLPVALFLTVVVREILA